MVRTMLVVVNTNCTGTFTGTGIRIDGDNVTKSMNVDADNQGGVGVSTNEGYVTCITICCDQANYLSNDNNNGYIRSTIQSSTIYWYCNKFYSGQDNVVVNVGRSTRPYDGQVILIRSTSL